MSLQDAAYYVPAINPLLHDATSKTNRLIKLLAPHRQAIQHYPAQELEFTNRHIMELVGDQTNADRQCDKDATLIEHELLLNDLVARVSKLKERIGLMVQDTEQFGQLYGQIQNLSG